MRNGQFSEIWHRFAHHDQIILSLVAVVVGVAIAYASILFRLALGAVQWLGYGTHHETLYSTAINLPWWQLLAVPALGGLVVGAMLHWLMPNKRPEGVADVIEANALKNGRMPMREGIYVAGISIVSLGAGASAGREGPMVHLGAAIASWCADVLHLGQGLGRTILACGVAAAVSASFNAPIAGVFFALEVILGHYALSAFAPVVIASVGATVISRIHLGTSPAFILPENAIASVLEFPAFALLGVVCAINAIIFMWSIFFAEDVIQKLRIPLLIRPAICGLAIGAIAILFPQVLGVGYEATDKALKGDFGLWLLIGLIIAKTAATAITIGGRFGGGVFSPSLFVGAATGGAFGLVAAWVFPQLATDHGAYAIVGMSALAAAVLGAPISTILIVFELTGDYKMTIAVMVATSVASVLVRQFLNKSFFHWQLNRRGLNLMGGRARHLLLNIKISEVLSRDIYLIDEGASIDTVRRQVFDHPRSGFFVVDSEKRLTGQLTLEDFTSLALETDLDDLINARDIARKCRHMLTPEDGLERALQFMEFSGEDHVPVVSSLESRQVIGIVHHKDALRRYNRALLQAQAEEHDEGRT